MILTLLIDHRFQLHPDGRISSLTHYNYPLFANRYLQVFDAVKLVTRIFPTEPTITAEIGREYPLGPGVAAVSIGSVGGIAAFAKNRRHIERRINAHLQQAEAVLMVAPGVLGTTGYPYLQRTKRPYGLEIITDPYEVYSPGAVHHPLRPLLRWHAPRQLRSQCAHAATTAYVTQGAIQERYPPAEGTFSTHYSSIELANDAFRPTFSDEPVAPPWQIVTIGSMAQPYKGFDVLLKAFRRCRENGLDVELTLIGDGKYRAWLETMTSQLGLSDKVRFLGFLNPGEAIRNQLDRAHLFVLPSRVEGLPRVVIEAMAREKACIGSRIGGMPELLPEECMVPPGDDIALAAKITEVLGNPSLRRQMAERNYKKANDYKADVLNERRLAHYRALREVTEKWLQIKS
jgi:glycosyltransferase involved in cell wall biosynthesis